MTVSALLKVLYELHPVLKRCFLSIITCLPISMELVFSNEKLPVNNLNFMT